MRPTKNLDAAVKRLKRAAYAEGLISRGTYQYGGSIASDILAVLIAVERGGVHDSDRDRDTDSQRLE